MEYYPLSMVQDKWNAVQTLNSFNEDSLISPDNVLAPEPYRFQPSYEETWDSAWRQYGLPDAINRYWESFAWEDEDGYDATTDPQLEGMQDNMWRFINSGSSQETKARIERLQTDLEDVQILANSEYFSPALVAGFASPMILAPVAPLSILRNTGLLTRFVGGAGFTAAMYAPEEFFITAQSETRTFAHTTMTLAVAGLIGGTVTSVFGGRNYKTIQETLDMQEGKIRPGVGANLSPELQRMSMYDMMDRDALAETGTKVEKLPWNPVIRLTMSSNPIVRGLASKMVDMGGLIQKKVISGNYEKMDQSVEVNFRTKYLSSLINSMQNMDKAYLAYRQVVAKSGDIGRSVQKMGLKFKDAFNRSNNPRNHKLSEAEFRIRVTNAIRNGADDVTDDATSFVNQAASHAKKHFDYIKKEATEVKIFERQAQKVIKGLQKQIDETTDPTRKIILDEQLVNAKSYLARIREFGVNVGTAEGYVPRIWRVDKLTENEGLFVQKVSEWARTRYGMTLQQSDDFAKEMHDIVSKNKPWYDIEEGMSQIDWITQASSTKARSFEIPDNLVREFLENDIEVLIRHHTKTMGTDIELTRKFGDISMKSVIDEISEEYARLIKSATSASEKAKLKKEMANDIRDIKGLRDRLRGTYGASKDPHMMSSRFVRAMKSFNVLVGMGSATISSIPDVVRTVMVEGLTTTYEKGIRQWFNQSSDWAKKMKAREMKQSAVAADAVLGLRAAAFTDIGDLFGSRFGFERTLSQSTNVFFILNGLNYWNQIMKEFAGGVTMFRMTESIMKPWNTLSRSQREKLLKNGIDAPMHSQMQMQIQRFGRQQDGEWFPNTDFWSNASARRTFRNALNQNVDRIIVTPGAGDRALWTSTEWGSLITQFKGYSQGAMVRMLTSGLQERDGAFWQGAFMLIGLAGLVNELKRVQYGMDRPEGFDEKLVNAIDRSGVTGWFMDANNTIEKMSNYKLGLKPFLTDRPEYNLPFGAKAGAIAGPTASNLTNAGSIFADLVSFSANQDTLESARFITPTGNLFYLDPIMDGIFNK